MSGQQRSWIPEPVTPESHIYRLCYRCGIEVKPSYGKPRQCRDCYEVERCADRDRAADLAASGLTNRQIAELVGVHRNTVGEWVRRSKRADKGAAVEACPDCRYHIGAPCTYHRQRMTA